MSSKIEDAWNSIPEERRKEFDCLLADTITKTKDNPQFEYGKIYPIEITKAFDSDEPKQWIYLKLVFSVQRVKGSVSGIVGEHEFDMIQRIFEAVEIYNKDDFYPNWIDHVNRIQKEVECNGENQMFFENTIFESNALDKKVTKIGGETKSNQMGRFVNLMKKNKKDE